MGKLKPCHHKSEEVLMTSRLAVSGLALLLFAGVGRAEGDRPLLLRHPTLSKDQVVFSYAGDLWTVGRSGGDARRLTTGTGLESYPVFSPDGSQVAFAGEYEGNLDVYVVPATGGEPRRLTYHPAPDIPVGWTPDGKSILFRSGRSSHARFRRLYTIPSEGGNPTELPLPMAEEGSFSPDGQHIAYVPFWNRSGNPRGVVAWKRYRGGTASPIWIADLADSAIDKLPRDRSNDFNPMWVGNRVYFLSDRDGPVTLYAYEPGSKEVRRLLDNKGPDINSACAGPGAIAYAQFGEINLFDLDTQQSKRLDVRLSADLTTVRPRFEKVAKHVHNAALSPTGVRAVFEAHGEILTVPAAKGDVRNLTNTTGVAERDPSWSPDGQSLAYFSDESGEYQLHVRPQNGLGAVRKFTLGEAPSFYYHPVWSPDGKKIAYTDKRMNFWVLDLAGGKSTKVDTGPYDGFLELPSWSPDSRWLAYIKQLKSGFSAVFLYSLEGGKKHQITDGLSDATGVAFDKGGKYLYFLASTDAGPSLAGGMASFNRGVTRSAYLVVLSKDDPSPLAPESDEEKKEPADKDKDKDKDKAKKDAVPVRIDLEDLDQRILALPVKARNYIGLLAGKAGVVFLLEGPAVPPPDETGDGERPAATVHRFELEKRKPEKLVEDVAQVSISHNGEKLLYHQGEGWFVVAAAGPVKPGEGALKTDALEVRVDPRAEWKQMYHEIWRIERDFLYDPNAHGYDLKAAEKRFARYLPGIASRYDYNALLDEMLGELSLGHVYIFGGDFPEAKGAKAGLLGADYKVENGRYRFERIYRGENWNPQLRAPLTQPGAAVKEGEYLLAVDGQDVRANEEVHAVFEGKAGKAVVLKVGPNADGTGAREVKVVPVADEYPLRHLAWVDANRRKVDQLSGGRVAYIYIPNTATEGYARFNRYLFPQADREAAVVDERFNGGGDLADHVIDYLGRPLRSYITSREGADQPVPGGAIFGPKVMLINEQAGSGGDYMPYIFRQAKLGPLVGKRTWGGLVGIGGYPTLIDGGVVTAPRMGIWFPNGKWDVENIGVAPDVEVEYDPKEVRAGHDPQLEKAVALVLEELRKNPPKKVQRPEFPNYHKDK
jgi:tricorn protease